MPACTGRASAVAVNTFETLPMRNSVVRFVGERSARLAKPHRRDQTTVPSTATASWSPGAPKADFRLDTRGRAALIGPAYRGAEIASRQLSLRHGAADGSALSRPRA